MEICTNTPPPPDTPSLIKQLKESVKNIKLAVNEQKTKDKQSWKMRIGKSMYIKA